MTDTIRRDGEGQFADRSTRGLLETAVEVLGDEAVVLDDGDMDIAAADLLNVLCVLHDDTDIWLETLPQARAFAIAVLEKSGWSE